MEINETLLDATNIIQREGMLDDASVVANQYDHLYYHARTAFKIAYSGDPTDYDAYIAKYSADDRKAIAAIIFVNEEKWIEVFGEELGIVNRD